VEKAQNPLVRGHQLCTQLSISEGCLAELFVFDVVNFEIEKVSQTCIVFDVVKFKN